MRIVQQVRCVIHFLVFLTKYTRIGRSVSLAISDPAEFIAALNQRQTSVEVHATDANMSITQAHFRHAEAEGMANHAVTTGRGATRNYQASLNGRSLCCVDRRASTKNNVDL